MNQNKSLFQINQEYLDILENGVDQDTGEITQEASEALGISIKEAKVKSEAYIAIIKKYEADAEILKQYEDQANKLRKQVDKKIEYLKKNLLNAVLNFGEINTDLYKISSRKSESVEITDLEQIPNEFVILKKQADKKEIKDAIKNGVDVPGAMLIEKENLQIK